MGGVCSAYGGGERGVHRVLVGKSEEKRPCGRSRHRWEDNIKMELHEVGCGLSWLRIGTGGGTCESSNEPWVKMQGIS